MRAADSRSKPARPIIYYSSGPTTTTATAEAREQKTRTDGRAAILCARAFNAPMTGDRQPNRETMRGPGGRKEAGNRGRGAARRSLTCRRLLSPKLISYLDRWLPCTTPTKNWDFFAASPIPPLSEMYVLFFRKCGVFFYPLPSLCVDVIYGIPLPC